MKHTQPLPKILWVVAENREHRLLELISSLANVPLAEMKMGELSINDWIDLAAAADLVARWPIFLVCITDVFTLEMWAKDKFDFVVFSHCKVSQLIMWHRATAKIFYNAQS